MRAEVVGVRVQKADEVAPQLREGAPHSIALAEDRAVRRQQLGLLQHVCARGLGGLGGAVGGLRVHHHHLVYRARLAQFEQAGDDPGDRPRTLPRRKADGHALLALGGYALRRVEGMMEGAGFRGPTCG